MERAIGVTRAYCNTAGIDIDEVVDPDRTCLIGPEYTRLMTTLGHLDAKQRTTDPAMAGLLVRLLDEAGVAPGDTIAVATSGSFPALLVASLAAAKAMRLYPVVVISLGASSYGATNERFNLLHLYTLLVRERVFDALPDAVSLGGRHDVGDGLDPELAAQLTQQIAASGVRSIRESDLRANVAERMHVYEGPDRHRRIAAFVNAGGSDVVLGTSALVLDVTPGLNTRVTLPPEAERGVLFEMAAEGVPVIHLLNVRGLERRYAQRAPDRTVLWLVALPYFAVFVGAVVFASARRGPEARRA
jgi:poly-gamma-glutamate system protein